MKSILAAAAAAIIAAAATLAVAIPGDAAAPRVDFTAAAESVPVEYFSFEPMAFPASAEGVVMEPLVIIVDAPERETIVMPPMHVVANVADAIPVAAL